MPPDRIALNRIATTKPHWRRIAAARTTQGLVRRRKRFAEAQVNTRAIVAVSERMRAGSEPSPRAGRAALGASRPPTVPDVTQTPPRPLFAAGLAAVLFAGLCVALFNASGARPHPALLALAAKGTARAMPVVTSIAAQDLPIATLAPARKAFEITARQVREVSLQLEQTGAEVAALDSPRDEATAALAAAQATADEGPVSGALASPASERERSSPPTLAEAVRLPPLELAPLQGAIAAREDASGLISGPRIGRCEVDDVAVSAPAVMAPEAGGFGEALATAAMRQTSDFVVYTDKYRKMSFPMGDVPALFGVCTDVVIRAYRAVGIDLQALIHAAHIGPRDPSIAHRRTFTLRRYFASRGASLPVTDFAEDYQPGDVVTYDRPQNRGSRDHIAIVTGVLAPSGRPMIVHNRGWGPQIEDALFVDRITGHYRYRGRTEAVKSAEGKALGKIATASGSASVSEPAPARIPALKHSRTLQRRVEAVKSVLRSRGLARHVAPPKR